MLARFGAMVVRPLTSMLLGFFHSVSVAGLNSVGSKEEASLALYEGSRLPRLPSRDTWKTRNLRDYMSVT